MIARLIPLFAALGVASAAQAHDYETGSLKVLHPYAIETAERATTGAGYFEIRNGGDGTDALLAVEADFPHVALHESVERDGMMTMQPLERIEIAPGETITLAPGQGGHVMFMGLDAPFVTGDRFPATLVFETAGEIEVEFVVEPRPDAARAHEGTDHGDMDHGGMDHGDMEHGAMDHGADDAGR